MKALIFALMLSVTTLLGADMTNGVFYADSSVECHLISQNGATITNQLAAGKTYEVGNAIAEIVTTNKTTFYIAGGLMIEVAPKSTFSINLVDVEVKNLSEPPRKADFGSHNISLAMGVGEFSVIYLGNEYSSLSISTPFISYELGSGKYLFRITEKSSLAFIAEGSLIVDGKKKDKSTSKNSLSFAIPFNDPISGVKDKTLTSNRLLQPSESDVLQTSILSAEKKYLDVQFFVVSGRVIGIYTK